MQIKKFLHNSIETLAFVKHWLLHLHAIPTIAKLYNKDNNEIFVVVNGPSLQGDIAGYESLIAQKDVLMVNQAIQTPLFKTLKPKYYAIVDTIFLSKSYRQAVKTHFDEESFDRVCVPFQKTFELFNTTEHNFTLFVPSTFMDGLKITNPRISTYTFGLYDFRGFEWLEKIAYKKALAMPSSDNILIFAIVSAIAMGYKRIYLLGCDQNAFLGYYVDNKTNKFSMRNYKHFYTNNNESDQIGYAFSLGEMLYHDSLMFRAYSQLQKLFGSEHRIFNCSSSSMIDAFPRASLDSVLGGGVIKCLSLVGYYLFMLLLYRAILIGRRDV